MPATIGALLGCFVVARSLRALLVRFDSGLRFSFWVSIVPPGGLEPSDRWRGILTP
jgi:hypothetical protein